MAYFAEIDETGLVVQVLSVSNEQEHRGEEFLSVDCGLGGRWIQTSFTSRAGNRVDPDTNEITVVGNHLRYNFASIGFTYDEQRDAFIPPQPYPSWSLDENACTWTPPKERPLDGIYQWDESAQDWVAW